MEVSEHSMDVVVLGHDVLVAVCHVAMALVLVHSGVSVHVEHKLDGDGEAAGHRHAPVEVDSLASQFGDRQKPPKPQDIHWEVDFDKVWPFVAAPPGDTAVLRVPRRSRTPPGQPGQPGQGPERAQGPNGQQGDRPRPRPEQPGCTCRSLEDPMIQSGGSLGESEVRWVAQHIP